MPKALDEITKDAIQLPRHQRLALAGLLLELDDGAGDGQSDAEWEKEIQERIRAIDEGTAQGIPYEQVMREAQERLSQ